MARYQRSARSFWIFLVVLIIVFAYGAYAAGTADRCGPGNPSKWVWLPPHWQCL